MKKKEILWKASIIDQKRPASHLLPSKHLLPYENHLQGGEQRPNKTDSIKNWITTFEHNTIQKEKAAVKRHTLNQQFI